LLELAMVGERPELLAAHMEDQAQQLPDLEDALLVAQKLPMSSAPVWDRCSRFRCWPLTSAALRNNPAVTAAER
jgi:hypothetical protein